MRFFTLMNRDGVVSRNKANEVAYVRRGTDHIEALGSGYAGRSKIPTVWVTTKSGDKYEIPVDGNGRVPEEYLIGHFLNPSAGSRGGKERDIVLDLRKDADTLHEIPEGGFTPRQLIETGWWQAVNESDIIGIDDTGSGAFARELEEAARSAQSAGRKMVFLMPEDSAARARSILARDFTGTELRKAVRDRGLIIKEGNPGRGADGCYISRQETSSLKTPVIILRRGWNEETLAHEFVHHLRHVDETRGGITRTPFKLNDDGERVSSMRYSTPSEFNSARNLEEASTVAESVARIQEPSTGANGYYSATSVHGELPYDRYTHDRKTLVPDKPVKGRRAERRVTAKFGDTSISHLRYYSPGSNAINYYKEREAAGTLPTASKPKKRAKEPGVGGTAPGPVGSTATKSPNRRVTRARR